MKFSLFLQLFLEDRVEPEGIRAVIGSVLVELHRVYVALLLLGGEVIVGGI